VKRHVNPVLPEEVIHFLLPAADDVGIPASQPQGLFHVFLQGRAAILGYKEDDFEHSP
jgi:hypothetical protein